MSTPEQIQDQIERTRSNLSTDVDRLTDKVSPTKVVGRRVERIKSGASSMRARVMGSTEESSGARAAVNAIGSKASDVRSAAESAPQAVRNQTQGNPLAAGLIAFGVGWLLGSLAPASDAEQQLAARAEEKAKDLGEPLKQSAQELAENLKEPVQQSVEQVKSTATEAAQQTAESAKSGVEDVKRPIQQ